jgi:hypothetical protein
MAVEEEESEEEAAVLKRGREEKRWRASESMSERGRKRRVE